MTRTHAHWTQDKLREIDEWEKDKRCKRFDMNHEETSETFRSSWRWWLWEKSVRRERKGKQELLEGQRIDQSVGRPTLKRLLEQWATFLPDLEVLWRRLINCLSPDLLAFAGGKTARLKRKAEIRKWARMSELISLQQVRFWVTVEFLSLHDEYPEMPEQQTSVIVAWYLAISNPTVSDFRFCRPQRKNWAEASKRFSLWNFTLKVLNPLQSWFCALTEIYHCFFQIKKREKNVFFLQNLKADIWIKKLIVK